MVKGGIKAEPASFVIDDGDTAGKSGVAPKRTHTENRNLEIVTVNIKNLISITLKY